MRMKSGAITLLALGLAGCGGGGGAGGGANSAPLDEATARLLVDQSHGASPPGALTVNEWTKVAIEKPHKLAPGEAQAIPPGADVTPAEISYTRTQTVNGSHATHRIHQYYLFYRDASGNWVAAATPHEGDSDVVGS
jgi:hypothetical protein